MFDLHNSPIKLCTIIIVIQLSFTEFIASPTNSNYLVFFVFAVAVVAIVAVVVVEEVVVVAVIN
ncbi:hypothetical protein [Floridanema evergladense]|uniref:NADH dehydrogenase subunit 4L n=1 Tax=Floridaenema evergladense BLCC-F167 TaxID=3153639 RepID=A0ABV4WJB0_9CYAN